MTTTTEITKMDRNAVRALNAELREAIAAIAAKHGVTASAGTASFDPYAGSMRVKVEFQVAGAAEGNFARDCRALGTTVQAEDLNREFTTLSGQTYRLTGINLRAPKYPFLATEIATGKSYKLGQATVERALRR